MRNFSIGADPEIFVRENRDGGLPMSAVGVVNGTKAHPQKVNGGAVQVDGMALEINIDPARNRREFITNINSVMQELRDLVPPFMSFDMGNPYMEFDPDFIRSQPAAAIELGCEPDYNGWTGRVNPRPDGEVFYRTAAGHVHIGWEANEADPYKNPEYYQLCCDVAKQMDYYIGIYSLHWDQDDRRRKLYGKAGAFRAKSYGIEYRTPSTAWLAEESLQAFVYEAAIKGITAFFNGDRAADVFGDEARRIIDNNEVNWQDRIDFGLDLSVPYQRAA